MRSFPCFFTFLVSLLCDGAHGFVPIAPTVAAFVRAPSSTELAVASTRLSALPVVPHVAPNSGKLVKESSNSLVLFFKNAGRKYMVLNEERPLMTKGVSAALVATVGDVFSQCLFAHATGVRFQWDMMRTLTFTMTGLCFKGPVLHLWYNVLSRLAHWTKVRKGFCQTKQSLAALTLDQTVGVAFFYPLYFVVFELISSTLAFRCEFLTKHHVAILFVPTLLCTYTHHDDSFLPFFLALYSA